MSEIVLVIVGFLFGSLLGAEICCYALTPWWFRREHRLLGFTPFIGGFLIYRKYQRTGP